ncbi:MAG: lycopene cyclase family protein [Bacteroidota bacterium]
MAKKHYDYIIIGAGAAGLNLAIAMVENPFFLLKEILILDKLSPKNNRKTWSFWEEKNGKWDDIITKNWDRCEIVSKEKKINIPLNSYRYKTLKSDDFYALAKSKINSHNNIVVVQEEVTNLDEDVDSVLIKTDKNTYTATYVFDSRPPKLDRKCQPKASILLQHFKGWFIKSSTSVFDEKSFKMMDFSITDNGKTSFTYVLPFSPNEALIEFTYFSPELVDEDRYDQFIEKYIAQQLALSENEYEVIETEKGIIPMTNYPFWENSTARVIKIGTAGGWVKASTGYSFKNAEKNAALICQNIINELPISRGLHAKKHRFYDSIFLDVLETENHYGETLFKRMYEKNKIEKIFRFLDEESNLLEELSIISSLADKPFYDAFFRFYKKGFRLPKIID